MPVHLKQVDDHIFVGTMDTASNYNMLRQNNIRYILNLTSSVIKINDSCKIKCMNKPISNTDVENLLKVIPQCIPFINEADTNGMNILICCRNGYTRTSVMFMAYYILKHNRNFNFVYEQLKIKVNIPDLEIIPHFQTQLAQIHCMLNVKNKFGLFKF